MVVVEVELREVEDGDLEILYEHQLDEQAAAMAGFPSRGRNAFVAHWDRIRADPGVVTRSIVAGGELAGNLAVFPDVGKRAVGYWIGREFWGAGSPPRHSTGSSAAMTSGRSTRGCSCRTSPRGASSRSAASG